TMCSDRALMRYGFMRSIDKYIAQYQYDPRILELLKKKKTEVERCYRDVSVADICSVEQKMNSGKTSPQKAMNDCTITSPFLIAFYLPQFHPIPENDQWWGKGFTEWTNVVKAKPLFPGHYQPHLPADLGFYDLRLPEIRKAQADLARKYGIYGFCYYHYWFNGKMLLDYPLQEVLKSGEPDFPFCLCWANENWTRAWDGRHGEILIQQNYSEEDDRNHIRWLLNIFKDTRYIRINNKPLMLIYLAKNIPDAARTVNIWREEAKKVGENLYLCKVESAPWEYGDPRSQGFDACVEFQPDWGKLGDPNRRLDNGHLVFDYEDVVEKMISKPIPPYKRFPCVTPMWDNSPRRRQSAVIFDKSTPDLYQKWLSTIIGTIDDYNLDENIIFINAWNEWAEGNHLEPDKKNERAYLNATKNALSMRSGTLIKTFKKLVSIVILTFNQLEYSKMCVKSILEHTPEPYEIIFVDNGSTDGTREYLQKLAEGHEYIHLILNKNNLGFAAGNNQALHKAKGDYIVLLNNDVVVTEHWLERMIFYLEGHPDIGMVGPMSNAVSGPQLVENVPYGKDMKAMQKFAKGLAAVNTGKTTEVMRLVGFCLLMKKEALDIIGDLDENYASGNFEDDDLCLRSLIAGYRNIIAHDVFVHHFGSMTFKGNAIDYGATIQKNSRHFADKWKDIIELTADGYRVNLTKEMQLKKLITWGEERFSSGGLAGAVRIFERVLRMDRTNSQALNNLGVIQWQLGDAVSALDKFQKSLSFNPEDHDALGNLAQTVLETERFDLLNPDLIEIIAKSQSGNPDLKKFIETMDNFKMTDKQQG
ncbi:MAG: glycoside hydrolase family 99-like domain-containing protein, partial [Deltaproteobacteria bacterium]|nr:glycoside hydrolase family 99-like domain-containing protein [Deltaproteobacteria bacterium]